MPSTPPPPSARRRSLEWTRCTVQTAPLTTPEPGQKSSSLIERGGAVHRVPMNWTAESRYIVGRVGWARPPNQVAVAARTVVRDMTPPGSDRHAGVPLEDFRGRGFHGLHVRAEVLVERGRAGVRGLADVDGRYLPDGDLDVEGERAYPRAGAVRVDGAHGERHRPRPDRRCPGGGDGDLLLDTWVGDAQLLTGLDPGRVSEDQTRHARGRRRRERGDRVAGDVVEFDGDRAAGRRAELESAHPA